MYLHSCVCVLECNRYLDPYGLPAYSNDIFPVFVKVHICGKLKPRSSNLTAKSAYFLSESIFGVVVGTKFSLIF